MTESKSSGAFLCQSEIVLPIIIYEGVSTIALHAIDDVHRLPAGTASRILRTKLPDIKRGYGYYVLNKYDIYNKGLEGDFPRGAIAGYLIPENVYTRMCMHMPDTLSKEITRRTNEKT